jgi:hypothetical protein
VVELIDGVDLFLIGSTRNLRVFAEPGQPLGAMYALHRWVRDDNGNRLIHPETGLPLRETGNFLIGNAQPSWTGGLMNTLIYRGFTLAGPVDVRGRRDLLDVQRLRSPLRHRRTDARRPRRKLCRGGDGRSAERAG